MRVEAREVTPEPAKPAAAPIPSLPWRQVSFQAPLSCSFPLCSWRPMAQRRYHTHSLCGRADLRLHAGGSSEPPEPPQPTGLQLVCTLAVCSQSPYCHVGHAIHGEILLESRVVQTHSKYYYCWPLALMTVSYVRSCAHSLFSCCMQSNHT